MILHIANSIAKCFPIAIVLILFILSITTRNKVICILFVLSLISDILNKFLKEVVFRNIYKKKKYIKYLGIGKRPKLAKGCSCLSVLKEEKLFGMPSGHSQYSAFLCIFLILFFSNNLNFKNKINYAIIILLSLILILITFYIMYTRIYITQCHTINQVIVGGLIGIIFGIISFYIIKKYII